MEKICSCGKTHKDYKKLEYIGKDQFGDYYLCGWCKTSLLITDKTSAEIEAMVKQALAISS